jgi:hypothetical protein
MEQLQAGQVPTKTALAPDLLRSDWYTLHTQPTIAGDLDIKPLLSDEAIAAATAKEPEVIILSPGANDETIVTDDDPITISGRVPADTAAVVVNDYSLRKFAEGDTTFSYNVSLAWDNLKDGENIYTVQALAADESIIAEAKITIMHGDDIVLDDSEETEATDASQATEDQSADEAPADPVPVVATTAGSLTITEPAAESTTDADPIVIRGTAPSNAAKIVVDDYELSQFTAGDATWIYRLASVYDNRPVGETTVEVKAYDADDVVIDAFSVTFTIEETPVVETPAAETTQTPPATQTSDDGLLDDSFKSAEILEGTLPPVPQNENEPTI